MGKSMISKLFPPLSGLTSLVLVIGYTTNGIARTLLLVIISIDTKFGGSYLKLAKAVRQVCNSSWYFVHQNELAPYCLEYAPP